MVIKTTIYINQEELAALMSFELTKGKRLNLSKLIRTWMKVYLQKNGITPQPQNELTREPYQVA